LERRPASPVSKPVSIEDTYAQALEPVSIEDTYGQALDPEEVPADVRARRVPSSWIDGVARLDHHRPLTDIPPHRWRQFLSDCNNFLTSGEIWAERADQLGWDAKALFGCRPIRTLMHPANAGLLWAINGGRIVELHRDWAGFKLAVNGSPRVFERRRVNVAQFTLPWIECGCGDKRCAVLYGEEFQLLPQSRRSSTSLPPSIIGGRRCRNSRGAALAHNRTRPSCPIRVWRRARPTFPTGSGSSCSRPRRAVTRLQLSSPTM
jgi:hypothetical protein